MKIPAPRRLPTTVTCGELAGASELAIVVVLAHVLDTTIEVLFAAHPQLASSEAFRDAPAAPLWVADALINQADSLKRTLDTYRHAVELRNDNGKSVLPSDDDIPW